MSNKQNVKKLKKVEEMRKEGTLAAQVDAQTGQEINPHVPTFILDSPWYLNNNQSSLVHQRKDSASNSNLNQWYNRGATTSTATKYRKGACTNCGALTHKQKDCLDRPRKVAAKYSNLDIKPDEVIQSFDLSFEAKRDRWNGYDPNTQAEAIKEWEEIDEMKRLKLLKDSKLAQVDDLMEEKYAEDVDMPGTKMDAKVRATVRNLRIREDTAKYLLNLDVNSSYYDPKSRAMRENPNVNMDPNDTIFAGDNFERYTGDTNKLAQLQMFAWDSEKRNNSVHMQANPTQAEFLHKQHLNNQQAISGIQQSNILEKYGGAEYLNAPAKELLLAQSEVYTEYSRTGQVIKGVESLIPKSIYQEDVLLFNHTSVFGSYWKDSKWGYKCCHSFLKNSYCVGIQEDSNQTMESIQDNIELFKRTEDPPVDDLKPIELKRKYNSLESSTVTEQELEEYRRSKSKFEYPMKDFV